MTSERRYLWIAIAVVALLGVALLVVPKIEEEFSPDPVSALVAVEVAGSGYAEVGRVELPSGTPFTLHAVLVAEGRQGGAYYYTQAPALRIGGEEVAPDRLRTWKRSGEIAVLWFTVEGFRPFMEVPDLPTLEGFRFEEAFRPEWGRGWSVAGSLTPRNNALSRGFEPEQEVPFGTMRYHVRIEKYFRRGDPAPLARYRSPGAEAVEPLASSGPGTGAVGTESPTLVVAALDQGLDRVTQVFGLSHLEPTAGAPSEVLQALRRGYQSSRSFSRLLVLGGLLEDRGLRWQDISWEPVEPTLAPPLGAIAAGDFLRSGERVVVFWRDAGEPGKLDYDDLCFDLAESAAVRRLNEVFTGGGVLDWADLDAIQNGGGDTSDDNDSESSEGGSAEGESP